MCDAVMVDGVGIVMCEAALFPGNGQGSRVVRLHRDICTLAVSAICPQPTVDVADRVPQSARAVA